jgi:hypothetical protein
MPLAQVCYKPILNMASNLNQRLAAITIVKVSSPPSNCRVDFIHYPLEGHNRPLPSGEKGNAVSYGLQGFLRWLDMGIIITRFLTLSHPDRESQEVKLAGEGIDRFRLSFIQDKPQPLQDTPQHLHSLARPTPAPQYDDVVRIADDSGA